VRKPNDKEGDREGAEQTAAGQFLPLSNDQHAKPVSAAITTRAKKCGSGSQRKKPATIMFLMPENR
jgi:hypothetical protein